MSTPTYTDARRSQPCEVCRADDGVDLGTVEVDGQTVYCCARCQRVAQEDER